MAKQIDRSVKRIVGVPLALLVLLVAGPSYAACVQGDLQGTWYFNGMSGDVFTGYLWETDFCKIGVNSSGKIRNTGSQCKFRDWLGKDTINVGGGSLFVSSSCAITGYIKYCIGAECLRLNIDDAKLDKGKTVITLVGRAGYDPTIVSFFTGVKR